MLKSRDLVICALLAVSGAALPVSSSRAGMFDLLRPKRPASIARRGQSPDAAYSAASTAAPVWQQAADQSGPQTAYSGSTMPTGWGYDSSPCFNCGENDHYQTCTRRCRERCHQTWYPRMAPYCLAGWGWTQPCWRRPADNYNCPRPEAPLTRSQPAAAPLAPAAEPSPPPPPPPAAPTTTVTPTSHASLARQAPGAERGGQTVPQRQAPQIQPEATRFTSFADTLEPEQEADEEEEVDDTLESRMEAADAAEDAEVADSDSEMEASDAETDAGDASAGADSEEEDESEPPAIEE